MGGMHKFLTNVIQRWHKTVGPVFGVCHIFSTLKNPLEQVVGGQLLKLNSLRLSIQFQFGFLRLWPPAQPINDLLFDNLDMHGIFAFGR